MGGIARAAQCSPNVVPIIILAIKGRKGMVGLRMLTVLLEMMCLCKKEGEEYIKGDIRFLGTQTILALLDPIQCLIQPRR